MALIERACSFADDGNIIMPEGPAVKIPIRHLVDALADIGNGVKTAAEVKAQSWHHGSPPMRSIVDASGKSDQEDFDALVAAMPVIQALRDIWLATLLSNLIQGETKSVGFSTPALIRTATGI